MKLNNLVRESHSRQQLRRFQFQRHNITNVLGISMTTVNTEHFIAMNLYLAPMKFFKFKSLAFY